MRQNEKSASKSNKKAWWQIRKNKPKMTKFSQKHAQYAFRSKLKQKIAIKFEEKAIRKQKSAKNKPKKQANFSLNKPKNKQPASLKKNCKSTKEQVQIRGKTARLATEVAGVIFSDSDSALVPKFLNPGPDPVSSEISDLCKISDLFLHVCLRKKSLRLSSDSP